LIGALITGFLIRLPGVLWGYNFPTGWNVHHIDEYTHWVQAERLINPASPLRWYHPYPKGTAAHVAVPWIAVRAATGQINADPPGIIPITVTGRLINVFYGTSTIFIVYLLVRRLFQDKRVWLLAAWIIALGGLHVTQSHFLLADIPGLFWFLLGSYFLILDFEEPELNYGPYMMAASITYGIAFGIKLFMIGLPSLVIITFMRRPRLLRLVYSGIFFIAGFVIVNLFSFNHYDFLKTFIQGVSDPYLWSWWSNLLLYIVEMPSLMSIPVLVFAIFGGLLLFRKYATMERTRRFWTITIVVFLPLLLHLVVMIFQLDHFLRHAIPLIPWIAMATAWSVVAAGDWLRSKNVSPALIYVPLFIYLAIFVIDGERVFIQEPRNEAAGWLLKNLPAGGSYSWRGHGDIPGYQHIYYPGVGKPDVIMIEMHHANHYLSGMGLKNSFPKDYRYIFDSTSQERVNALQGLFKGSTEYIEVASFPEGYIMPEYNLVNNLIGDRSRNYVTEVVIFAKSVPSSKPSD
jgi:hypothetical protein